MGQEQEGGPRVGLEAGLELRWELGQAGPTKFYMVFVLLCYCTHIPITGLRWLNLLHRAHVESVRDPNQADLCRSH